MSAALEMRAEIVMLARLLGRAPDELGYLAELDPDRLRATRRAVTDLLFAGDRAAFSRLAAGSRLEPDRQRELIGGAADRELWVPLLTIAAELDPDIQAAMIDLIAAADGEVLAALVRAVDEADSWERLAPLAASLPPDQVQRLTAEAGRLGLAARMAAITRA